MFLKQAKYSLWMAIFAAWSNKSMFTKLSFQTKKFIF